MQIVCDVLRIIEFTFLEQHLYNITITLAHADFEVVVCKALRSKTCCCIDMMILSNYDSLCVFFVFPCFCHIFQCFMSLISKPGYGKCGYFNRNQQWFILVSVYA